MPHIELPSATRDIEVRLHDPEKDALRKFKPRVLTRSRKRELAEAQDRFTKAGADLPDEGIATVEQEELVMRAACDLVNVLLDGGDGPDAGDLLYEAWAAEDITDDQVFGLIEQLAGVESDPT